MFRIFIPLLFLVFSCNDKVDLQSEKGEWGKVVAVADGDTFTYLNAENKTVKVRLHGIDCPEKKQDYGQVAKQKLSDLIFGEQVEVVETDIDRYKRVIAKVYTKQNKCVNEELLKSGLAWHYKQYDKNETWAHMEQEAKRKKLGLWSMSNPTPPWEWRKQQRAPKP